MNNDLQTWRYSGSVIRTVTKDGEPWFVAKDLSDLLQFRDAANALRSLEDSERGTHVVSTLGGDQLMTVVSESGMYALIFKSRKKEATYFRAWVTGTVLPEIRKHGTYVIPTATPALAVPATFSEALFLAAKQAEQIERQQEQLALEAPKVDFYDAVADVSDTTDINTVAKTLAIKGLGGTNLFQFLRGKKILMWNNRPYQRYIDARYFREVERLWKDADGNKRIYYQTRVYPRGIDFIRKLAQGEV